MKTPVEPLPVLVNAQQYHGGFESFSFIDQWLEQSEAESVLYDQEDHLQLYTESCLFRVNPTNYIVVDRGHVQVYTQEFYEVHFK